MKPRAQTFVKHVQKWTQEPRYPRKNRTKEEQQQKQRSLEQGAETLEQGVETFIKNRHLCNQRPRHSETMKIWGPETILLWGVK